MKIIEKLNTEKGKRVFRLWARGMFNRQSVIDCYMNAVADYFDCHKSETLKEAKDYLFLLTEVIPA